MASEMAVTTEIEGRAPFLKIEHLTKMFDSFTALEDISLEIDESEFVCFLGPSGCGKTTLLRCIAGLDIQTRGRIEQAGRDISALPPSDRDFGIVFQSYALFPNLTVYKNVGYGLENRKMAKAEIAARVDELLRMVGLTGQGDKHPAQLSGGEQQRVALARALATSPGLLLLDEPLSALDAKVRVRLRHEIKQLQHKLGVTTILVTHDQEEALTMADRIVVMNEGVIEQVGMPLDIYRRPASRFVANFVGVMNFLPGVGAGNGKVRVGGVELAVGESTTGLSDGAAVTICIRPEDVIARGVAVGAPNAFEAIVSELEFLGSFFRANLRAGGTDGVEFRADFSVNLVRDIGVAKGGSLAVALPEDRIRVFVGS